MYYIDSVFKVAAVRRARIPSQKAVIIAQDSEGDAETTA